jgi:hypothetical protein
LGIHVFALTQLIQRYEMAETGYTGAARWIKPAAWKFTATMSLSNGSMMYSLALPEVRDVTGAEFRGTRSR